VPGDPGYADTIVSQGGHSLVAVDELLDYGLVLDWDNGIRFAVPLDGTGLQGVEAAEFTGKKGLSCHPEFDSSVGAWARNSVIFQGFRACDGIAPCA